MSRVVFILLFFFSYHAASAQGPKYDSLKSLLSSAKEDSTKFRLLRILAFGYMFNYPDSSLPYIQRSILLAKQMKSDHFLCIAYGTYGWYFSIVGDYAQALYLWQDALKLAEKSGNLILLARCYDNLTVVYMEAGDYRRAISLDKKALALLESKWKPPFEKDIDADIVQFFASINQGFGYCYNKLNIFDSALAFAQKCDEFSRRSRSAGWSPASYLLGSIYLNTKDYQKALQFYHLGIEQATGAENNKDIMDNYTGLAKTFKTLNEYDSSIFYASRVLDIGKSTRYSIAKLDALQILSDTYSSIGNSDSTVKYLQFTIAAKDSLFSHRKIMQIQNMTFIEEQRQQKILDEQVQYRNKIMNYALAGGLISVLAIAALLYRNNRQKQRARLKVEKAYSDLKNAQAQLIQSEKMASLGELTAGIAHEIQNPLNFVNNFSEVNTELLNELKDSLSTKLSDVDRKESEAIISDINQNLEKINQHGKRADSIVKGMLQHSRSSKGQKEPTDINALADEYLRLSYHGMRAKDGTFNVALKTDFDKGLNKISIVSQDIGRVLLNLYNNAFHSMMEKAKLNHSGFEPTITVATQKIDGKINITVRDNGTGIPEKIKDKIFQPFFTTKPTGQGTGLGLSLSYDIIKAHGGEISVESKEGVGSEFVVQLPVV